MIWLKGKIRFIQAGAAVTLILAASGPVLLWKKSPETVILRDHSATPAAALAKTGAAMRYGGKIDFHSSFYESAGSIEKTAASLAVRDIALKAIPHHGRQPSQPVLRQLHHPAVIGCGERWEVQLELAVPSNSKANLSLREKTRILFQKQYTFPEPGFRRLKIACHLQEPGEHTFRLELNGRSAAELAVRVEKPYPVLLISRDPIREGSALRRLLHGAAEVTPWKGGMDFSRFPLIVIGERGGQSLKQSELKQLSKNIRKGSGLLIFTGRDTPFIPRSLPKELEAMLPVRYTARNLDRTPTTSLVVIIDTSGSMMGTRIALARETARLALDKLRDCDLAGIVEFHGRRRWAAPLQSAANHLELRRALNRLNAGGGTIILPAVREAFYALRNADTRLKHVLIITDGGVEQGNFEELLRQMARNDITVSTVLAGNGQSPFLEQLALWGGGRYYTASSRFAIPELTFRQTGRESLSPVREGRFPLEIRSRSAMTAGLSGKMMVGGILETSLNPGADELVGAAGLPLIARKNTGNGSVVSVNTELDGPWVKKLRTDPHFSGMLASLARSLPDPARLAPYAVRNYSIHRCVDLQIDSFRPVDKLHLELNGKEHFVLKRGEDGSFHFRRSGMRPEACRVGLREMEKGGPLYEFKIIPRQGPENGWCADDLETAERINRRSARIRAPEKIPFPIRLRPVLGIISLLLFLLQVLVRRLPGGQLTAVILLIACGPAFGGEYEQFLQAGLRNRQESAAMFRKAVQAAKNPSDRRFALMLELEAARRTGTVKELLREWEKPAAADPERLDLLLCELEDDRQEGKALDLLLRHADLADRRFTIQLIRLAEKCGKTAIIRDLAMRKMKDSPEQLIWLNAAVRLELLAGRRTEAVRLYDERIRQENDQRILSAIADAAEKTALYSCAESACLKLEKLPGSDPGSVFRRIDLQLRKGDPRSALKLAHQFAGRKDLDPGTIMSLADRCERLGDPGTALKLYRRSDEEEALIRQAMLLGGLKRNPEAVRCWEKLLRNTENDMRAMQSMERIIALSAEDRQLPRLIHSLEGNPEVRKSERMKLFYCRALLAAGNTDRLWKFLDQFGSLEQKLNFRLETRQFSEAVKLLEESLKKHPEKREELLRSLIVIAIESKDLKLAERSVEELMKTAVDRKAALQFSAGVYTLLDQPSKA
ncbi:MAG: VWA domain-containing protein, partial [Lentisphaeria bacterium]|nr:VWA domain-containing protein [Lentisphaeria bacterium]